MALDLGCREQGCPAVRWCHHLCSDVDSLDGSAGGVVWPGEDEPVRVEGDASFRLGRVWLDASLHRVAARDWSGRAHLDARVARIRFREDVGKVCACVRVEVSRDLTCCHVGAVGLRVIRQPERVEVQELRLCVVEDAAHPAAQLDNRIRGVLPQLDELLRELRHNVRIRRSASVVQRHAVVADTVHDVSGADNIDVARYPHACGRVVGRVHHEPRGACLGEEVRGGLGGVGDEPWGRCVAYLKLGVRDLERYAIGVSAEAHAHHELPSEIRARVWFEGVGVFGPRVCRYGLRALVDPAGVAAGLRAAPALVQVHRRRTRYPYHARERIGYSRFDHSGLREPADASVSGLRVVVYDDGIGRVVIRLDGACDGHGVVWCHAAVCVRCYADVGFRPIPVVGVAEKVPRQDLAQLFSLLVRILGHVLGRWRPVGCFVAAFELHVADADSALL